MRRLLEAEKSFTSLMAQKVDVVDGNGLCSLKKFELVLEKVQLWRQ